MEVLQENSRFSVLWLECNEQRNLPSLPDVTEPSFVFHFSLFGCVKDGGNNVVQARLLTNNYLISSRTDFSTSVRHDYLLYCLVYAGLSTEEIEDLFLQIQSKANSIVQGRDTQLLIPMMLSILTYDYFNDGDNAQLEATIEASMQETVVRMLPGTTRSMQALRNIELDEDRSTDCCVICMEELGKVVKAMPCEHYFHQDCILQWLNMNHVCPLCRFELPTRSVD